MHERLENNEAIAQCITHFYRYSPIKGLAANIRKPLQLSRGRSNNSDLLIQNEYWFLHEVVSLRKNILEVDIKGLSQIQTFVATTRAGWQAAELMGNTFKYMQNAAAEFGAARKELVSTIDHTISVMKTLAGAGLSNSPAPGGIADTAGITADTIGELLSKWALQTGTDFNITELATKLAFASDTLKRKSLHGLLVPGYDEIAAFGTSANSSQNKEKKDRQKNGLDFYDMYSKQLKKFKEHYLEESVKTEAKALE